MTNPLSNDPRLARIFEADAALTAPGAPFEVVEDDVLGERMPVFANRHANLREQLLFGAEQYGDRDLYVWSDGRRHTFTGLVTEVAEVAAGLRDRFGIGKGDRVAICAANCPEWILTFWACAVLDAVLVAMNGWWTGPEMRNAIELTDAEPADHGREAPRPSRGSRRGGAHARDRARLGLGARRGGDRAARRRDPRGRPLRAAVHERDDGPAQGGDPFAPCRARVHPVAGVRRHPCPVPGRREAW